MSSLTSYLHVIERRRALEIPGYATLADVGFDGDYVSPYQIQSRSDEGPIVIAYNWLDVPSIKLHREILQKLGYLPVITFNKVMDRALDLAGLKRSQIYVTQAFHLLPQTRSQYIPQRDVDRSFDQITRHEIAGRQVIALGDASARACRRFGIRHAAVCHPSARGRTREEKAREIATALTGL